MAKSLITIKIYPYLGQMHITGEFVAGAEHIIVVRNERDDWEGTNWTLTVKEAYTGDAWAYGEDLEINSNKPNIINGTLNLYTTPIWEKIVNDDSSVFCALLEFQEVSNNQPTPYSYAQDIVIRNLLNRPDDSPPLPADVDEFEDGQGVVLDKTNNKWIPADILFEPEKEEVWKAWYNGDWANIEEVNGGEV